MEGRFNHSSASVWMLGVVLYFILAGELPFYSQGEIPYKTDVLEGLTISLKGQQLLAFCLEKSPSKRAQFQDILSYEWFRWSNNPESQDAISYLPLEFPTSLADVVLNVLHLTGANPRPSLDKLCVCRRRLWLGGGFLLPWTFTLAWTVALAFTVALT